MSREKWYMCTLLSTIVYCFCVFVCKQCIRIYLYIPAYSYMYSYVTLMYLYLTRVYSYVLAWCFSRDPFFFKFAFSYRNRVSIKTNKLRFHCFVPNIRLPGLENRTFDWLNLKTLECIVSVLPCDLVIIVWVDRFQ